MCGWTWALGSDKIVWWMSSAASERSRVARLFPTGNAPESQVADFTDVSRCFLTMCGTSFLGHTGHVVSWKNMSQTAGPPTDRMWWRRTGQCRECSWSSWRWIFQDNMWLNIHYKQVITSPQLVRKHFDFFFYLFLDMELTEPARAISTQRKHERKKTHRSNISNERKKRE